jgi:two-component system sensor histidine kinase/response regulator
MGRIATRIFEQAEQVGGLRAKIALAVLTRTPSTEATSAPDSPELIARLEAGLVTIRQQFARHTPSNAISPPLDRGRAGAAIGPSNAVPQAAAIGTAEPALRAHLRTYLELMTQRSLFLRDVDTTIRRVTEAAASALEVERVSVWLCDEAVTKITCADLYQRPERLHSSGLTLSAADYQPYFVALRQQRTIAAHDAHTDPRTACFSEGYLTPLGISSMLDVPIWLGESMVGVVCHEAVGPSRVWTLDEETFANLMASFVALAMELRKGR